MDDEASESDGRSDSSGSGSDGSSPAGNIDDLNLVTVQEEYNLKDQELKACRLFGAQLAVNSEAAGWDVEETARLIHLIARTLDFSSAKLIVFINELKIGSPVLIATLIDQGYEFTTENILTMIKQEAGSRDRWIKSISNALDQGLFDLRNMEVVRQVHDYNISES